MKQREFEKDVKGKMDALGMQPSDEVWLQVERRIRKEKKRRFIYWLPLSLLLLTGGAGIYFLLADKKKNNTENIITADKENFNKEKTSEPIITEKQPFVFEKETGKTDSSSKTIKTGGSDRYNTVPYDNNFSKQVKKRKEMSVDLSKRKTTNKLPVKNKKVQPAEVSDKKITVLPLAEQSSVVDIDKENINTKVADKDIPQISLPATDQSEADKNTDDISRKKVAVDSVTINKKNDSTVNAIVLTPQQVRKKEGWKWGGSFLFGNSSLADGFTVFNKSFATADAFPLTVPQAGTLASSSSSVKKGAGFNGEIFIKKPVSEKLDLRISAGYSFLSWKLNVGTRVDTILYTGPSGNPTIPVLPISSGYYRVNLSSSNNNYTNSYHLLGLSAELSWKIISGKKVNLYWDNGLGYKRLLSSNMLHYSSALPGYYKDNKLLARNQLFFLTGLSLSTGNRFYIGPTINYGLTSVLKDNIGVKRHYSAIGINARFLFRK